MRSLFTYVALFGLTLFCTAQRFSDDKEEFRAQALAKLRSVGTESANKIAFDFQNAWDGKFTSDQQDQVHRIGLEMQRRGFNFYPTFYHYFAYLAYSVAQENLQRDELTKLLTINEQVLQSLTKQEYQEFVFGLNIYFARRYLSLEKTLTVQASGGTYSFGLIGDYIPIEGDELEKKVSEDTSDFITEEEFDALTQDLAVNESVDNTNSGWDDTPADPWSSTPDWNATNAPDPWANSNDPWSDSNDDWGNDNDDWDSNSSWDNAGWDDNSSWDDQPQQSYAPSTPKRPDVIVSTFDHIANKKSKYLQPELKGPSIDIKDALLFIVTPRDSLRVSNMHGTFLLQNRSLVGRQGTIRWPGENKKFKGATVQLKDFYLKRDRSDFWTPNASVRFESLFDGEVEGVFEYRSVNRPRFALSRFPTFTSFNNDVRVKLGDDKVSYVGGVELRGNELFGKSVSRKRGTLTILDGRGNQVLLKSKEFKLGDSIIYMDKGSLSILHGFDSITHKQVTAKYDIEKKTLTVLRSSTITPYISTYFDLTMNFDLLKWNMEKDSIAMEVQNGKDLIPATFESDNFFNEFRYRKLARFLNFHPVNSAVYYSRRYNTRNFYLDELVQEYKIDKRFAIGGAKLLEQYGFGIYNRDTEEIQLLDKAFHYYDASAKKVDYDNLMVPSIISSGPNAYIRLDSGKLKVRGVHRFHLTTDFKVYVLPYDSTVTLLEGKNMEFDGEIHAGDFDFQGRGHQFDYQAFLFNMPKVDSMRITVPLQDTTEVEEGFKNTELENQLTSTSGTLYINEPDNKSGKDENSSYPFFASLSEAIVYFDGPEILDGAYDKSVFFIAPPFRLDSIEREDGESIAFQGTFNSGGIFPTFQETLHVQEDQSLGFTHKIPDRGYNLYGTEAKTYEEIRLSNKGMRGYGEIDFLSTKIYSDDFIYYPDSVTTNGTSGSISPGNRNGASYPEAVLGPYDMYWLPRKDSMYLRNIGEPFKFYNSTAQLDGEANITTKGVFGSGTMLTRGSRAVSKELTFQEFDYGARHAEFEVLTNDPEKPAMEGEDIRLDFDLRNNTATIRPEKRGVAAISFPYAQMKTSITEAVWDLEDSVVTMTKPDDIPIEDSYFFSTREYLDSLAFNAEKAIYDINTQELSVQGIPYIIVADSKIIPENNETTILANSVLQRFNNAEIIIDTLNGYHYLDRASIRIVSSKKFEGNAYYKQIIGKDTFDIRFDSFELVEVPVGEPDRRGNVSTRLMTVSGGEVMENQNLIISSGFKYKGSVTMYAYKKALELDGLVRLDIESNDNWIYFLRTDDEPEVQLPFDNAEMENGGRARAGIHLNIRGDYYSTFVEKTQTDSDLDFFNASGLLTFSDTLDSYKIENYLKTTGESYEGNTMIYNDATKDVIFEGPVEFFDPETTDLMIKASALGKGNKGSDEYEADVMMALDFQISNGIMDIMALDLTDIIERIGPPPANDISLAMMYKMANMIGDEDTKYYETASLKDYTSLVSVNRELEKPFVISGVKMKWSKKEKAWYNTTKLGLSNIMRDDLNAKLDGFIEIKKDETGADMLSLFLQAAPGVWYYFGYTEGQIVMYSSNPEFNQEVDSKSNIDKAKPEETVFVLGDENETLGFINNFRLNYFGVKEPYNLVTPDDVNLEDESFDTIEEDDEDDGFGFE